MSEAAALLEVILESNADVALSGLERFSHGFDSLANKVKQGIAFSIGFAAAEAGLRGITDAFHAVGEAAIGLNSQLQQTEVGFKTMLGSAEAAKAMMADLADFALRTPFELKDLGKIGGQFLAMGFQAKQVIPILTDVGNAAAAMGTGQEGVNRIALALSQMSAAGKVTAQDMRQLTEARIPAWQILADAIGKTTGQTRDLVEQGLIPANTFLAAFEQRARSTVAGGWGNAMADQANTFKVAFDNAREAVGLFLASGFKPLFDLATEGVVKFRDLTQTERWARWGEALTKFVGEATAALRTLLTFLKPVGDAIGRVADSFADIMGIPQRMEKPAEDTGKNVGLAFADGVSQGLAGKDPFKAITEGADRAIAAIRVPLTQSQTALDDIKAAGEAAVRGYQDQIDKIDGIGSSLERISDIERDRSILQLSITEAALKEKEARERILDAARTTITASGHVRFGTDPTDALKALDIQTQKSALEANKQFDALNKKELKAPWEALIESTKKATRDTIAPIEEMNRQTENIIKNLEAQRRQWEEVGKAAKDAAAAASGVPIAPPAFPDIPESTERREPFKFDPEAFKARLGKMFQASLDWIGERKDDLVKKFQDDWGPALWKWLEDTPEHLNELGRMKARLFDWIGSWAGPLWDKFRNEWGPAIWQWIETHTPIFIAELGHLKDQFFTWIAAQSQSIHTKFEKEWGPALAQWTPQGVAAYESYRDAFFREMDKARPEWEKQANTLGAYLMGGLIRIAPSVGGAFAYVVGQSFLLQFKLEDFAGKLAVQAILGMSEALASNASQLLDTFGLALETNAYILADHFYVTIRKALRTAIGQAGALLLGPGVGLISKMITDWGPEHLPGAGQPIGYQTPTIPTPLLPVPNPNARTPVRDDWARALPPPPPTIITPPAPTPIRQAAETSLTSQGFGYIPTGPLLPAPSLTTTAPTINLSMPITIGSISGDVSDAQVEKLKDTLEQEIPPFVYRQLLDAIHASGW